jgi:hypothetical protein
MALLCEELESTGNSAATATTVEVNEVIAHIEREFARVRRALEEARIPAAEL